MILTVVDIKVQKCDRIENKNKASLSGLAIREFHALCQKYFTTSVNSQNEIKETRNRAIEWHSAVVAGPH